MTDNTPGTKNHRRILNGLAVKIMHLNMRREEAILAAKAAGEGVNSIASKARLQPDDVYRILAKHANPETDPAKHGEYAPQLVLEQPTDGLTVAIGSDTRRQPATTFTFDAEHPVLMLLGPSPWRQPDDAESIRDVWPVIAASAVSSNARVSVYGRLPHNVPYDDDWDLPTYLGPTHLDQYDARLPDPSICIGDFDFRTYRIAKGENLSPLLVHISDTSIICDNGLEIINTALAFGHQARIYVVVETGDWVPSLAVITSRLTLGGSTALREMLPTGAEKQRLPKQFDTAILSTPEGTTEFSLPPTPGRGQEKRR